MDMQTMNYNVCNKLDCNAGSISNVNIGSAAINGLEAIHDELLLQLDHHVTLEDNPERLVLDDSMAQSTGSGVNGIIIAGVSDNIEASITTTNGISAKTNATVCKTLAVLLPIGITTPAIINGISSST